MKYEITVNYTQEALEQGYCTEQVGHYKTYASGIDDEREILWIWGTKDSAWGIEFKYIEFFTVRFI